MQPHRRQQRQYQQAYRRRVAVAREEVAQAAHDPAVEQHLRRLLALPREHDREAEEGPCRVHERGGGPDVGMQAEDDVFLCLFRCAGDKRAQGAQEVVDYGSDIGLVDVGG